MSRIIPPRNPPRPAKPQEGCPPPPPSAPPKRDGGNGGGKRGR